ncbi:MAG: DUF2252 domain-containing protein, partial [Deltaproteobacteria bacterium]|nr:DUF2252 domain-containing protein [Deltaproteobacteria bacterium]
MSIFLKSTKKDRSRKEFLNDVLKGGKIRESDEVKRAPHAKDKIQTALDGYATARGEKKGFYKVKDVAIKAGSGTASLGQERFWVLIEGKSAKDKNDKDKNDKDKDDKDKNDKDKNDKDKNDKDKNDKDKNDKDKNDKD